MSRNTVGFRWRSRSGAGWIVGWRSRRGDRHRLRPGLLELEERRLLATFPVTSTADDNSPGTLRYEINEANAATGPTTIEFSATVFSTLKTIALIGSQLELSNTDGLITITGPAAGVNISAGGLSRVFQVNKGVTASISGLTMTGGKVSGNGGALDNLGTVTLTKCTISGSTATSSSGGGLFSTGTAYLINCTVSGNSATYGGGLFNDKGTMTLTDDCTVSVNKAGYDGGGLGNSGTVNLTNCNLSSNKVYPGGGGGLDNQGTAYLTDCTLESNSGKGYGGLYNSGTAKLTDCTVSSNLANFGGGVGNFGTANLTNCILSENMAGIAGGGLDEGKGQATLTDCTISGNVAQLGGGVRIGGAGKATLTDCTLSGNSATAGSGGGLRSSSYEANAAILTDCTISGNSASNQGGGLYKESNGTMDLTACTVSGNSASNGGGLYNTSYFSSNSQATLTDTIVAGNTLPNGSTPNDIQGPVSVSGSDNLIGPGGAGGLQNGSAGNIVLGDLSTLGLAPLGFYGGPTQTMALLPGSAAIHNGTMVSGVTTDQRGESLDSPPDIGAFQVQTGLVVNTISDGSVSVSGDLNLRQAVNLASALDASETITFDASVFATAQTITLMQGPLALSDTGGTETITGTSAGLTISGGGDSRVFDVAAGVTAVISELTITGGSASTNGGGLYNQGTTTIADCTITGNLAKDNGGGLASVGTLVVTNCTIRGNSASGGGGLAISGTASLTDCTISGNSAGGTGGGLYNQGAATLEDTIVAGNTGSGGTASDIHGSVAGSSSFNLVGTGGSGGLSVSDHNLLNVADPDLAPLGEYGGPTETLALLPGSAAIGAGTAVSGITTDQRGASRPSSGGVNIGAFQDQGYTLAVSSGSSQSTFVSQAFASPLVAELTENDTSAPLPGVTIGFSAPSSGASATLGASSAVTDSSGRASITATANATAGTYVVTASVSELTSSASFTLTNQVQPTFSGLSSQTISYGSTVTFSGTLAAGSQVPVGEDVAVTVDSVTQDATIASDGSFSIQFTRSNVVLNASLTAYSVTYVYAGDRVFLAVDGSSQLTVNPAALTIAAKNAGKTYGQTLTFAGTEFTTSGLVNGDTVTSVTLSSPGTAATATVAASPYAITATAAVGTGLGNYTITYAPGQLTVNPSALTITAKNAGKTYGQTLTFAGTEFTTSGLVNGDGVGSVTLNSPGAAATATVAGSPYAIKASNAVGTGLGNYTITYVNGQLTVNPAPLTIAAKDLSKTYGQTLTLAGTEFTASGLVNGDAVSSVTLSSPGAAATATVAGSPYAITASAAIGTGLGNYTISYVPGQLTVNPAALTIAAVADTKTYDGTTNATVVPKITSGSLANGDMPEFTETYSARNVGTGLTLTPSGTVNDGNGGHNYTYTFVAVSTGTITPALLTVTAKNDGKAYGQTLTFAGTEFTTSGLVNGDTVSSVTLNSPGAAATVTVAGSPYSITVSSAAGTGLGNYTITYINGQLTVNPAALTITAKNAGKTYGQTLTLAGTEFTTSGLVNGDTVSTVTLTSPGAAATAGAAGSPYAIAVSNAGGTGLGNYTITYAPGTLTVTPATLTITAGDATKVYGAALPALTASYSGFVNGDTAASLATPPSLSTTATATSPVVSGGYPITASGAVDPNYAITYVAGTLTVTLAPAAISVSAPGGTFNASPFSASVTLSGTGNPPAATLENVSPRLTYYAGSGTSGTKLGSTPPAPTGTYTVVAAFPGSTDFAATQSSPISFTIAQAPSTVVLTSSGNLAVFGQPIILMATVTGPGTPAGSVLFTDGGTTLATVPLDASGRASITTSALGMGSNPIVATYSGNNNLLAATSSSTLVSVTKADTRVILVPRAVNKRKKVASLSLDAEVQPLPPGAGVPSGTVTFEVRQKKKLKVISIVPLNSGSATVSVKPSTVRKKSVTIVYGGDSAFQSSSSSATVSVRPATALARVTIRS